MTATPPQELLRASCDLKPMMLAATSSPLGLVCVILLVIAVGVLLYGLIEFDRFIRNCFAVFGFASSLGTASACHWHLVSSPHTNDRNAQPGAAANTPPRHGRGGG
jgi:hypothetical protein